ncbi:L-rhamnose/proton symporter RhaT [Sphingobacteriaceae bacterium]|nr:L-rhamnose/proton symporter RhaT [Sphingobacteriaceae bacterium]
MNVLAGIIFHLIGGGASGSFYLPYKKVKGWAWESYWIVGGLFSWLIVPPLAAWLTVPGFFEIIRNTPFAVTGWTFFFGLLWGIGGLTYGLGVRYLGMSLGNSITLGFCSALGAIIPSVYYDLVPQAGKVSFTDMCSQSWGLVVLLGIVLCLTGIYICGRAGVLKERELSEEDKKKSVAEFSVKKGITVAIISGTLSACFNFGIEAGQPMAETALATTNMNPLFQNNVIYVVLLWGGLTTNFIWCMILNAKNKTAGDYTNKQTPLLKNYIFSALAGTTWFLQFFFYGMGESKLGNGASSWILHMTFIILIANTWGIVLNEWKGVSTKTRYTIITGIVVLITSVVVVAYGNSINH